jgi:ribosomal protein S18 acetylase RimI-like enzyme
MDLDRIRFRRADASDAVPIAQLHADSWRRHYRGAYSDAFLDGGVARDRLAVWSGRLSDPGTDSCTIVAEDGDALAGFAHTAFDEDGTWGALLDNLHVAHPHQRSGIGSKLFVLSAGTVVQQRPRSGLYLWVLDQNRAAQAFYSALGGQRVGRGVVGPPGGDSSRLSGTPIKLRYAWPDPARVLG